MHSHIINGIPVAHLATLLRNGDITVAHLATLLRNGDINAHACEQVTPALGQKQRPTDRVTVPDASPDNRLSADESDRLFRVVHTIVVAEILFGSRDKAQRWLSKPQDRFSGNSPIQMLISTAGAWLVEELLTQLAEGFVL
ncbi:MULTISPECIES: antitoxin Xre/MbcA/ParS toxin-binding domain-containing protein [Pseudomonadaceae]|uniref:antitoxin Xre/MbcA/ParS toxin-binding domain-containing protein n=1 Tax=Pseudomonadaceae TaxID=135621 RepID=UPI001F0D74A8|nr:MULTISPECIES: antitoxin Xre/MbcA/ParS toxin-binding domain-containing protein [Pseudomonas]